MVSERPACSIDGCDTESVARGWCKRHWQTWYRHGDPTRKPEPKAPKQPKSCSVEGCDKPAIARGWCSAHWTYWRRHGADPADVQRTGPKPKRDPLALTGGEWRVDRHGVQRFHFFDERPADEDEPQRPIDPSEVISMVTDGLTDEEIAAKLGTSRRTVARVRATQGIKRRRAVAECGTPSGYTRHVRDGTEKCRPCRDAKAAESARVRANQQRSAA